MKEKNFSIYNKIGSNIKKIRELKEITRETMASELHMSLSGYSRIERNEIDLTLSRLENISYIFKINLAQLLYFDSTLLLNSCKDNEITTFQEESDTLAKCYDYRDNYIKKLEEEVENWKVKFNKLNSSNHPNSL